MRSDFCSKNYLDYPIIRLFLVVVERAKEQDKK